MALGTFKPGLKADSFHGPQTIAYCLFHPGLHAFASARYLLRRPAPTQQCRDLAEQRAVMGEAGSAPAPRPTRIGLCTRRVRLVGAGPAVAVDLVRDGARRSTQVARYGPDAQTITQPNLDHRSVKNRQIPPFACHPTILDMMAQDGCSLRKLNPPFFFSKSRFLYLILGATVSDSPRDSQLARYVIP